jgi:hypothetical protein
VLIVRTPWPKNPLDRQLPDLRVQLLDLAFAHLVRVDADARIERPRRVVQQLLLEAAPPLRAPA